MLQPSLYHAEVPPGPLRRRARSALDDLDGDVPALRRFLAGFRLDLEDAASALSFSGSEPVRKLVARNEDVEMVLHSWLPGQSTPIEVHEGTPSGLRVLAGRLTEDLYQRTRDGEAAHRRESREVETGGVVVHAEPVIHRYRNASGQLTVTLHVERRPTVRPRRLPSADRRADGGGTLPATRGPTA